MATGRDFVRSLIRLSRGCAVPRGFIADGRTLGLGLAAALQAQRDRLPSDEEIERLLREHYETVS